MFFPPSNSPSTSPLLPRAHAQPRRHSRLLSGPPSPLKPSMILANPKDFDAHIDGRQVEEELEVDLDMDRKTQLEQIRTQLSIVAPFATPPPSPDPPYQQSGGRKSPVKQVQENATSSLPGLAHSTNALCRGTSISRATKEAPASKDASSSVLQLNGNPLPSHPPPKPASRAPFPPVRSTRSSHSSGSHPHLPLPFPIPPREIRVREEQGSAYA